MTHTNFDVRRDPSGGRVRMMVRSDGPRGRGHLGVRVLDAGPDRARVALLAAGALLVAGDEVCVGLNVGSGVRLDVVEPAGTVAFDMRGGSAQWTVAVEVGDEAELVWRAEPFVIATGAVVERDLDVALHGTGTAVLREVLVLGRVREDGGALRQRLRVTASGRPLLAEDLALDGRHPPVGVIGAHRVVDSVSVLGRRAEGLPTPEGAVRLELDGEGTVVRHLGTETHTSPLEPFWSEVAAIRRREPVPA
ncbi:MAG: urease accessory protein UreD [Lapillicoccus sp.]